jgi:hypothetical protein
MLLHGLGIQWDEDKVLVQLECAVGAYKISVFGVDFICVWQRSEPLRA